MSPNLHITERLHTNTLKLTFPMALHRWLWKIMTSNYCVNEPNFDGFEMSRVYLQMKWTSGKKELKIQKIVLSVTKINSEYILKIHA